MTTSPALRRALTGTAFVGAAAFGPAAFAAESPTCGETPEDAWMEPEAVQERVETLGYTVEDMGVSDGNCYKVSGMNIRGESVTTYLDPRTGDIVQEDIAQ